MRRRPEAPAPADPRVQGRTTLFSWGTRDRVRTSLKYNNWAVPILFAAAGTILGLGLPYLDRSAEISVGLEWDPGAATAALFLCEQTS